MSVAVSGTLKPLTWEYASTSELICFRWLYLETWFPAKAVWEQLGAEKWQEGTRLSLSCLLLFQDFSLSKVLFLLQFKINIHYACNVSLNALKYFSSTVRTIVLWFLFQTLLDLILLNRMQPFFYISFQPAHGKDHT